MALLKVIDRPYPAKNVTVSTHAKPAIPPPQKSKLVVLNEPPLPSAPEIESAVLGAIFSNPEQGFATFERIAKTTFFFSPVNRQIYEEGHRFFADNKKLDLIAFTAQLGDQGKLNKLGGASGITELFIGPTGIGHPAEMVEYYIGELRKKYLRRCIMVKSFVLAKQAAETTSDLSEILSKMRSDMEYFERISKGITKLEDASRFLNGNCPPLPPEIVYKLLHLGSKMVVGGTSKGRKTMALIDLAVSVATGYPWWGFNTKRGPICYINFEIQDPFFWYRVNEVCSAKGVNLESGMFYAWNLRGRADGLEHLRQEIINVLKSQHFLLVIIDPIYKALGDRDENKAGDVASMLNELEKIAVQTGSAVAFGAHYSKGNQSMRESVDRIGGSGVFARDPDTILTMTAHEKEECFTVEGTLRNFPPMYPFVVKWEWPLFCREDDADPNNLKKARGSKQQFVPIYDKEMVLNETSIQQGVKVRDLYKVLHDREGISQSTFYRFKQELEYENLIEVREGEIFRKSVPMA